MSLVPLNITADVSDCPYGHKISADILLETDEILLLKTKLGVLLYVVIIHPVYSVDLSQGAVNRVYINYILHFVFNNYILSISNNISADIL